MKLYKAQLELRSALRTPLKGDTIWGHIVWGLANHEGEDAVAAFLQSCKKGEPPLVVSSAFPTGMLPRPLLATAEPYEQLTRERYAAIKAKKRVAYIPSFLDERHDRGATKKYFIRAVEMRNVIDRGCQTVVEGGLFATESFWPNAWAFKENKPILDLYIASSLAPETLLLYLHRAFEHGYGADASTGKGVITLSSTLTEIHSTIKAGNTCLALGPFVLDRPDAVTDLRADVFLRRGKVGGGFATTKNPYKKPIIFFNEGATFIVHEQSPYIGSIITAVHTDDRICHSGFCPIIALPAGGSL